MKKFLINKFGKEQGEKLYIKQQKRYSKLVVETRGKSESQMKTLKKRILPRIALYEILQESKLEKDKALKIVELYFMKEINSMVKVIRIMEKLPFFYDTFRRIFSKGLKADNWELSIEQSDNKAMVFTIKKCLWYDTCLEHKCPELCPMFCNSDIICYGSMKKITFKRTQTLGMGGECCDFKFINNKSSRE